MKHLLFSAIGAILLSITILSCGDNTVENYTDYTAEEYAIITKKLNLPGEVYQYTPNFRSSIFISEEQEQQFKSRKFNHKATLGRVLFYDNKLSLNESVSCASCHKQNLAFADDVAFSEGFDGEFTTRNSLPLGSTIGFETAYGGESSIQSALFSWDESNHDVSSQSKAAILSDIEMGLDMETLVDRIQKDEVYPILFGKCFDDEVINEDQVLNAIEVFVNSIVSADSDFDFEMRRKDANVGADFKGFTDEENLGKKIYLQNCASCHSSDHNFTRKAVANNGLDLEYEDKGVGARTQIATDNGVFKVPFLRNIALTGPYMHDGRFETLHEVIDHYSEGIMDHPNLNPELKTNNQPKKMNFTDEEKNGLIAYLHTLTDKSLMEDVRFADPFK